MLSEFVAIVIGSGGAAGPVIDTVTHNAVITSSCPVTNNLTITYTASSVTGDDTVKIYRIVDDGAPFEIYSGPLLTSDSITFVWGRRSGATSMSIRIRVEAYNGGTEMSSSKEDANTNHNVDPNPCPE